MHSMSLLKPVAPMNPALTMSTPSTALHPVPQALPPAAANDGGGLLGRWLLPALDHAGRGMLLVTETGRVLHANRLARAALDAARDGHGETPLVLSHGQLSARTPSQALALSEALANAAVRGLRRLLTLGDGAHAYTLAVLPLDSADADEGAAARAVLVSLPQRRSASAARRGGPMRDLALGCFARQCGLTAAETVVLEALVEGRMPTEIAQDKGVQLSTVRTQIGQLRVKTGAHSIRDLIERVTSLPPMMTTVM
jgi:DNA-binding CsgD family transcriptional regulator